MNLLFNNNKNGFTMVANKVLCATNLSLKAKALYAYLSSKPNHWNFSTVRIAKEMKEGKDAINNIMVELEELKLLSRRKMKDDSGKWDGVAYYLADPDDSNVTTEFFDNRKDDGSRGKGIDERKEVFRLRCLGSWKNKKDRMSSQMGKEFFEYWTELTYGGQKMRFEMQTAFDIPRRMETWIRNSKNFSKPKNNKQELPINNT